MSVALAADPGPSGRMNKLWDASGALHAAAESSKAQDFLQATRESGHALELLHDAPGIKHSGNPASLASTLAVEGQRALTDAHAATDVASRLKFAAAAAAGFTEAQKHVDGLLLGLLRASL